MRGKGQIAKCPSEGINNKTNKDSKENNKGESFDGPFLEANIDGY